VGRGNSWERRQEKARLNNGKTLENAGGVGLEVCGREGRVSQGSSLLVSKKRPKKKQTSKKEVHPGE